MDKTHNRIAEWAAAGESHSLPSWEELPGIPLYMDQVIFYLNDCLGLFREEGDDALLTSSMINNYVKNQVLPHPEKKKYSRRHLGALTALCMLKQVLPLQDVKTLLDRLEPGEALYNLFRQAHTQAVRETCQALSQCCQNSEDLEKAALELAVQANAKRAAAQRILRELASGKGEEETGEE